MTTEQAVRLYMAFFDGFKSVGNTFSERLKDNKFYSELLVDTVEKQIPKQPVLKKADGFELEVAAHLCCPFCGESVINYWNKSINPPHCMMCGQALDWSGENAE